ncbi:MAG TPA: oligosaccharide flippase family protein [Streptosporangiaceae bacterium]|nr:oligosaccharide flippase family protein [Streptosporangiaceae bacterium]
MPRVIDVLRAWRSRLEVARDSGLLAGSGAVLLMCAPVLPGLSRVVVLPALLLAPGYAFLRLLGQASAMRSISVAVPVSLVLAVCASLLLGVSGIRLGPASLGLLLGVVTALFLAGSYRRQLAPGPLPRRRGTPSVLRAPGDHPAATNALRAMFTRDFVYLGVSVLQVVLVALVTPILTRRVGVGQYGQLALAIVVAQLLGVTLNLGLPFAAQKVFAGEDGDRRSRAVLAISAVLTVAASLVVVLAAPVWGPAVGLDRVADARLAAVWAGCFALTMTSLAMLRSGDRLRMAIFVAALQSVGAQAVGVLLLYWWTPAVTSYLCGLIIGQGAAALIGLLTLRPVWSALAGIRRYGAIFLFGLPMVPQQLSGYILGLGDRVVIRHVLGSAAVGRYSVAYNVGSLGFILLVFVGWVWMPRIYAVTDRVARARLLASSRDMMNLLFIPVVCGLAAGAPLVLGVWVPKSFHPAELTPIVAIVAICTFPFGQFQANLRALMSEGRTGRAAMATLVAAVVNIGLNVVMVPFLGITGSAIATVLSYALCARLTRPPVSSGLQVPRASVLLRILIGGAVVVTLAIGVLPTSPVWLAIRLAIGAGALLAFALLLRRAMAGFEISPRLVTPVALARSVGPG